MWLLDKYQSIRIVCLASLAFPLSVHPEVDTFGIVKFHPTRPGTAVWSSVHWANGIERTVRYSDDPHDPTGWTEDHSAGTDGFRIDGAGSMVMSGSGPRFHVNSLDSAKVQAQFFRDVEFTAYYMRLGTLGKPYAGMVAGVRSGPLGHGSEGGDDCEATTYYARFRNDGKWDFEKELKHPGSTYWSGSGYARQDPLWNGAALPVNRWIGMKFIVYNENEDSRVRLELYVDSVSNGKPENGGTWEMVGSVVDSGSWPSGDVTGCGYGQSEVISRGNGTILMRTDGDTAVYKMVSVREIEPVTVRSGPRHREPAGMSAFSRVYGSYSDGYVKIGRIDRGGSYAIFTLSGKVACGGILRPGKKAIRVRTPGRGIFIVRIRGKN